jgi:hypothetical protein
MVRSQQGTLMTAFLAPKNKCLAERNKSSDVGKATKKRRCRLNVRTKSLNNGGLL